MGAQWVETAFPSGGFRSKFAFVVPGFVWLAIQNQGRGTGQTIKDSGDRAPLSEGGHRRSPEASLIILAVALGAP